MRIFYFILPLVLLSLIFNGCARFNPNNQGVVFYKDQAFSLPAGAEYTFVMDEKASFAQYSACNDGDVEWMESSFASGEYANYVDSNVEMVNCTVEMKKSSRTNDARVCRKKLQIPKLFKDNPYDAYCMVNVYSPEAMELCITELYEFNKWNKLKLMKMNLVGCSSPMSERELQFRSAQKAQ